MEMKEYKTPAMEVIKLSVQKAVLQAISGSGSTPQSWWDGKERFSMKDLRSKN